MIGKTLGILIMLAALLAASQSVSSEKITSENNKSGNVVLGPPIIFNDAMNIKVAGDEMILNCTVTIPEASPAPMSDSDILATHNAYRIAVGEDPLVWSTELASYAQDWANFLVANNLFQHSYGPYGENLAAGPLTDSQLVDLWGAERQYFKCGTFPDVSTTGAVVGHYTQMIWPDTEECGCAIASSSTYPYGKVLVCEYNPPGNFIGQYICPPNTYPNKPSIPFGPTTGTTGTSYSYSTSATDPDGNQVKYTFMWDDGTPNTETGLVASGTSQSLAHTWSTAGTYHVQAMATDSIGATSAWSSGFTVTITSPNRTPNTPSVPNGTSSGVSGTAYSYSTSATDPDGNQVKYTFMWDDGTPNTETGLVASGTSQSLAHTWSTAGTYHVQAMATDSIGATSAWSSGFTVTITSPNRTPNTPSIPTGTSSGVSGTAYSYSTSATDPDGNQVKYTFMWDDGTPNTETGLVASGTSQSLAHTWSTAGTYHVQAMATDSIGATSAWSSGLTVTIMTENMLPTEEWNRTFGTTSNDVGNSVLQTSDDGYVFTGYTWYGGLKANLIKTDAKGNQLWNKTYNNFQSWSVDNTSDDGYILTGNNIIGSNSNGGIKLLKTDVDGNEEWVRAFTINSANDYGSSVQQTLDGGYIITGALYDLYKTNISLIKTDPIGNILWVKSFGKFNNNDAGGAVQQTKDGGYIVTGGTESYGAGNVDAWLIKTDSLGNEQWNKTFGGIDVDSSGSVQQTLDEGYIIAGSSSSYRSGSMGDVWLVKTDSSGNEQWNKTFGGITTGISPGNIGRSVQQTIDNGYIVTGHTAFYGAGGADVWLIKTDSLGNELWNMTFGGTNFDIGRSVQQTNNGGYIIAGTTESYGAGGADAWLIKVGTKNTPPLSPSTLYGPTTGTTGSSYNYSTSATDPDSDQISYNFDWGDGTNSTTDLSDSGAIANATHIWNSSGVYQVRAMATDSKGASSEWSSELEVTIEEGDIPVQIGIFRNGGLYFDANSDKIWSIGDTTGWFGATGDLPVAGDWDGNDKDEIAVFRNGGWYCDANGDRVWSTGDTSGWFGATGDQAVAGDWDGNGKDEIAVFRNGGWYFDANGDGYWTEGDTTGWFGATGDQPAAGDWDGDGKDEIAVFRNGGWYFDANGDGYWSTGDTTGWFGAAGDKPAAGDWDGNGKDEIAVFRNGGWYFDANGDGYWTAGDTTGWFGASGDMPVAGRWGSSLSALAIDHDKPQMDIKEQSAEKIRQTRVVLEELRKERSDQMRDIKTAKESSKKNSAVLSDSRDEAMSSEGARP